MALSNSAIVSPDQPAAADHDGEPDLQVGGEAELTLTFATAGMLKARVPIVNADEEPYATISPSTSGSRVMGRATPYVSTSLKRLLIDSP